jgi:hypothetical protein
LTGTVPRCRSPFHSRPALIPRVYEAFQHGQGICDHRPEALIRIDKPQTPSVSTLEVEPRPAPSELVVQIKRSADASDLRSLTYPWLELRDDAIQSLIIVRVAPCGEELR